VIKPYDPNQLRAIERAIRDSDLGVNPTNDGTIIRVVFPQLTEERRRELVKVARHKGEEAKVSIRNVRRHAKDALAALEKDAEISQDELRRAEQKLQQLTDKYVAEIDSVLHHKEQELLEV
jgi:ribosome recycling factor